MTSTKNFQSELNQLDRAGLGRSLRNVMTAPRSRATIDGREVIMLGSNNYLGLSTNPEVMEAAIKAIEKYGTGSSGSRLTSGNCHLYERLEAKIAQQKKSESAIVFSSGYLANVATIPALMAEGDVILSDQLNHASIIDACRLSKATTLIYRHCNLEHLGELLEKSMKLSRNRLIVTDGVFSMDGDIAPLPEICTLAEKFSATVLIDDAHGFGVLGKNGGGTVEHFALEDRGIIQMGTLSKAIGGLGGYVVGSRELTNFLLNRARGMIFSTGLPPATLASSIKAIELINSLPELRLKLLKNSNKLRLKLLKNGFNVLPGETPIIPLMVGVAKEAEKFSEQLFERGVYAPAIRPPTVPIGESRLRISTMATHTEEELETAIKTFISVNF